MKTKHQKWHHERKKKTKKQKQKKKKRVHLRAKNILRACTVGLIVVCYRLSWHFFFFHFSHLSHKIGSWVRRRQRIRPLLTSGAWEIPLYCVCDGSFSWCVHHTVCTFHPGMFFVSFRGCEFLVLTLNKIENKYLFRKSLHKKQFFNSGAYQNNKINRRKNCSFFFSPAFSTRVAVAIFFVAFSPLEVPSATPPPRSL